MTDKAYQVISVVPVTYIDEANQAVNGYKVTVRFYAYNELAEIRVKTQNPDELKEACEKHLTWRKKIDELG